MSHVSHHPDLAHVAPAAGSALWRPFSAWPFMPYALVFAAGASGLFIGRALGGDAAAFEDKLVLLLRFMAGMKLLGVLAAAAALHWRLKQPIGKRLALAYALSLVPMAAAAGLIWSLGGIALGALLFHLGLLAFLALAWTDGGARVMRRTRAEPRSELPIHDERVDESKARMIESQGQETGPLEAECLP